MRIVNVVKSSFGLIGSAVRENVNVYFFKKIFFSLHYFPNGFVFNRLLVDVLYVIKFNIVYYSYR